MVGHVLLLEIRKVLLLDADSTKRQKRARLMAEKHSQGLGLTGRKPNTKPTTRSAKKDRCAICKKSTNDNPHLCARCDEEGCHANICPSCAADLGKRPGVDDWYCEEHDRKQAAASVTPPPPGGAGGGSRKGRRRGGEKS